MVGRARINFRVLQDNQGRASVARATYQQLSKEPQDDVGEIKHALIKACGMDLFVAFAASVQKTRWVPNRLATVSASGRGNAAKMLDQEHLHQWATESW